jgi:hypothetical protein
MNQLPAHKDHFWGSGVDYLSEAAHLYLLIKKGLVHKRQDLANLAERLYSQTKSD